MSGVSIYIELPHEILRHDIVDLAGGRIFELKKDGLTEGIFADLHTALRELELHLRENPDQAAND